jgi:hypothetical protein
VFAPFPTRSFPISARVKSSNVLRLKAAIWTGLSNIFSRGKDAISGDELPSATADAGRRIATTSDRRVPALVGGELVLADPAAYAETAQGGGTPRQPATGVKPEMCAPSSATRRNSFDTLT